MELLDEDLPHPPLAPIVRPTNRLRLASMVVLAVAACGKGSGTADAGPVGSDAGGNFYILANPDISSAFGVFVSTPAPLTGEGKGLFGTVLLGLTGGMETTDGALTIDGISAPSFFSNNFDLSLMSTLPAGAKAGGALTLVATGNGASTSLTLHCPDDFQITSPSEGAHVDAGSVLLAWTGRISYGAGATVRVRGYSAVTNTATQIFQDSPFYGLDGGESSLAVTVPTDGGYLIQIGVRGEEETSPLTGNSASMNYGACVLYRRVHVVAQ